MADVDAEAECLGYRCQIGYQWTNCERIITLGHRCASNKLFNSTQEFSKLFPDPRLDLHFPELNGSK